MGRTIIPVTIHHQKELWIICRFSDFLRARCNIISNWLDTLWQMSSLEANEIQFFTDFGLGGHLKAEV